MSCFSIILQKYLIPKYLFPSYCISLTSLVPVVLQCRVLHNSHLLKKYCAIGRTSLPDTYRRSLIPVKRMCCLKIFSVHTYMNTEITTVKGTTTCMQLPCSNSRMHFKYCKSRVRTKANM